MKLDGWNVLVMEDEMIALVRKGKESIMGAYFDREGKRFKNVEFMDDRYQKNNKTRQKAIDCLRAAFPNYY
jgi:hypothetical protein